jgi:tetratricopeptide (TPR) repeat protein
LKFAGLLNILSVQSPYAIISAEKNMSTDKELDPKEIERRRLLEEIRRRAEEEELKRIEDEEARSGVPQSSVPEPATEESPAGVDSEPEVDEARLIELRSELAVAMNAKDLPLASDLFLQLSELIPGTREIKSYEKKLRSLRQDIQEERERAQREEEEEEGKKQKARESRRKKVEGLYKESASLYQQEKYDRALKTLASLVEIDPANEEAIELRMKIEKAKTLAEQLLAEEALRKAKEGPATEPAGEVPMPAAEKGDVWGGEPIPHGDVEFGIQLPKEEVPRAKVSRGVRVAQKLSNVRVPVKPLLTVLTILALAGVGYYVGKRIAASADDFTHSLLILPGWYSPADSTAEYLSYALAEGITDQMSAFTDLRLIGPQSAVAVRYVRGGPAAAARQIGVRHYMHWTIRTTPASVTFDLTLRDTAAVDPIWTSKKESSVRELPAAITEIVRSIQGSLGLSLPSSGAAGPHDAATTNPDAYLAYLRGRFMLGHPSRFRVQDAAFDLRRAIEIDPALYPARSSLAWALLAEYDQTHESSLLESAGALLSQGPEILPFDVNGLMAAGLLEQARSRYDRAEELLTKAVTAAPGSAEAHRRLAAILLIRGKVEDALNHSERAVNLDPLNASSYTTLGFVQAYGDEFEAALRSFQKGASRSPDREQFEVRYLPELYVMVQRHDSAEAILSNDVAGGRDDFENYYRLGRVYQAEGKPIAEWREAFERAGRILERRLVSVPDDASARSFLSLVHTRLGRYEKAKAEIGRAMAMAPRDAGVLYNVARSYSMQRDFENALTYLDRATEIRYDIGVVLDMDFYNLHTEEGFVAAITR